MAIILTAYSIDGTLYPARWYIIFRTLWDRIPADVLWLLRYLPNREYRRFRTYLNYIRKFGQGLISQTQVDTEAAAKDVISVLLRANGAEEAKLKLSDRELIDQISSVYASFSLTSTLIHDLHSTIILAGHVSDTCNSL